MPAASFLLLAISASQIQIVDDGRILTDVEARTFLNAARCTCDTSFDVRFDASALNEQGSLAVVHGKRCVDSEDRISDSCTVLWRGSLSGLRTVQFSVSASEIADCSGDSSSDAIAVLSDAQEDGVWREIATLELPVDTEAPPKPKNAKVLGGEELAEVVFERPEGREKIQYQVLCEKDGSPVFDRPEEAAFVSAQDLCGEGPPLPSARFVCAKASGGTDSVTVLGLENGQTYRFYVVTVDPSGNPSEAVEAGDATPSPELDLWEVYRNNGGRAGGGHCFVATAAFGDYDHPQVVLLRDFRDRVLAKNRLGREAIALYYRISPPFAAWIARSPARRRAAQLLLWPFAAAAGAIR